MKTGTWYVAAFVVAFVYFYVYAVNYVRGDEDVSFLNGQADLAYFQARQARDFFSDPQNRQHQRHRSVYPQLSWQYHNYTSMTTFLRHVSTIYSNLTALYSIGQSVQERTNKCIQIAM